jgi:light-regulated signal transduction histidine kinase (bacteriophytochrome)
MNPSHLRTTPASQPSDAEHRLKSMHKVCHHDLPNQLVVLQSLLKLMEMEEAEHLSEQGREFVRRMQNASQHASSMVRFLKEMSGLSTRVPRLEPIALAELARELQGELQHLYPMREFTFAWDWQAPKIVGDARIFAQALIELYAGLTHAGAERSRVSGHSRDTGDSIELAFCIEEQPAAPEPALSAVGGKPRSPEDRMQIVLAREWLALCGANIGPLSIGGAESRFSVIVSNRK